MCQIVFLIILYVSRIGICVLYGNAPFVYLILLHFKVANVSKASVNTSYVNTAYLSNLRIIICVSDIVGYTPALLIDNSAYGTTD